MSPYVSTKSSNLQRYHEELFKLKCRLKICKGQILFLIIKKCHFTIDPSPSSKMPCDDKQSCLQKHTPLMNIGEECKTQFGCENGHCPSCGFEGLCCRKDVTGCGCSGLVGGETRHECTRDAGMTIYNIFRNIYSIKMSIYLS